jgi:hypothetical protein
MGKLGTTKPEGVKMKKTIIGESVDGFGLPTLVESEIPDGYTRMEAGQTIEKPHGKEGTDYGEKDLEASKVKTGKIADAPDLSYVSPAGNVAKSPGGESALPTNKVKPGSIKNAPEMETVGENKKPVKDIMQEVDEIMHMAAGSSLDEPKGTEGTAYTEKPAPGSVVKTAAPQDTERQTMTGTEKVNSTTQETALPQNKVKPGAPKDAPDHETVGEGKKVARKSHLEDQNLADNYYEVRTMLKEAIKDPTKFDDLLEKYTGFKSLMSEKRAMMRRKYGNKMKEGKGGMSGHQKNQAPRSKPSHKYWHENKNRVTLSKEQLQERVKAFKARKLEEAKKVAANGAAK